MLTISDEILSSIRMSETELLQQLALFLYSQRKFSMGQARQLTGMNILEFQELMCANNVYHNYSVKDLNDDIETLKHFSEKKNEK